MQMHTSTCVQLCFNYSKPALNDLHMKIVRLQESLIVRF